MKRLISLLVCVCLLISCLPMIVAAAEGTEILIDSYDTQWSVERGTWQIGTNENCVGPKGNIAKHSGQQNAATKYDLSGVDAGRYDLYVYNLYFKHTSTDVLVEITTEEGMYSGHFDPAEIAEDGENKWVALGTYSLGQEGDCVTFRNQVALVYRDAAIKLVPNAEDAAVTPELTDYTAPEPPAEDDEENLSGIIDCMDSRVQHLPADLWEESTYASTEGPTGKAAMYVDKRKTTQTIGATAIYDLSGFSGAYDLYIYGRTHSATATVVEVSVGDTKVGTYDASVTKDGEWIAVGTFMLDENAALKIESVKGGQINNAAIKVVPNSTGVSIATDLKTAENTTETIITCNDSTLRKEQDSWSVSTNVAVLGPTGESTKYTKVEDASATYDVSLMEPGRYDVYVYNLYYSPGSIDVLVEINAEEDYYVGHYNPKSYADLGKNKWVALGTYTFDGKDDSVKFTNKSNVTYRDAGIMLVPNADGEEVATELTEFEKNPVEEEIVVEPRTIPENSYILLGSEDGGFTKSEDWKQSGVSLPTGKGYYSKVPGVWAQWMLHLNAAEDITLWYLVPSITQTEDPKLKVEVYAEGKTTTVELDFTTGDPRWVELGTFDFSGNFDEYVKIIRQEDTNPDSTSRLTNLRVGYASAYEKNELESVYTGTDKEILQRLYLLTGTEDGITETYIQSVPTKVDLDVISLKLNGQLDAAENYAGTDTTPITAVEYAKMLLGHMGYVSGSDFAETDALAFFNETVGTDVSAARKFTINTLADMTVAALHANMKGEKRSLLGSVMAQMEPIAETKYTDPSVFTEEMREARETAKNKDRTLIYNNDGNDAYEAYAEYPAPFDTSQVPDSEVTIENFLAERMTGLEDSQVDSVFYCTGVTGSYHHQSEIADMRQRDWAPLLIEKFGTDSLEVIQEWCQENNREFMWSMRMNDYHDRFDPDEYLNTFKRENLDLLVCDRSNAAIDMKLASGYWSCVDYGEPEVRQWIYDMLREVLMNYDVDGIELDFSRFGVFFEQVVQEGEDANAENLERMNNLMRSLRSLTEQVSAEKGKPILIAVHVADSMAYSKATGLDVEQWLEEDLVDVVSIRCYGAWQSMEDGLAEYEDYDVPVYLVMDNLAAEDPAYDWSKEAGLAYELGYDGIQIYNIFDPESELFNTLGSKETTTYDPAYTEKNRAEVNLTLAKDSKERFMTYRTGKELLFTESEVTKAAGDRDFVITAIYTADGAVTYSSSDPSVATVDPNTGRVQICGVGTTEITASAGGASDSYMLTVVGVEHTVELPEGVTGGETAVYLLDYSFTSGQAVEVTVNGQEFTDLIVEGDTYTLPGEFVTGEIVVTVKETETVTPGGNVSVNIGGQKSEASKVTFSDVAKNAWYAEAVNFVTTNGIMNGVDERTFAPDVTTTRAMIVTMLYRMEGEPKVTAENPFADVAAGQYYTDAVVWAAAEAIVNGMDSDSFAPNAPITREQLAAILYRYAQYKGHDVSVDEEASILGYTDAETVSEYAVAAMTWAVDAGIINGIDGKLEPQGAATRAQVAVMLMRFAEK